MRRRSARWPLTRVEFLWPENLLSAVNDYARRANVDRTAAVLNLVQESLQERARSRLDDSWKTSGAEAQVERLLARLARLEALSQEVARCTFGIETLLIDWFVASSKVQMEDSEVATAMWRVGEDALHQLLDEAERGSSTPSRHELEE